MLIRFIYRQSYSPVVLNELMHNKELEADSIFLFRRDGYFFNKNLIEKHIKITEDGRIESYDDIIVYTDDEQMLGFAQWNESIHNFNVEIMFDDKFIPLKEIHPNLRYVNNIAVMFQKGIFDKALLNQGSKDE